MLREFQAFIDRGNVIDLAVAVVIGAAFGRITASLVDQVIMPPLGLLIGGVDFAEIGFTLRDAAAYASIGDVVAAGAPGSSIGAFINTVISFLIIAFAFSLVVRIRNRAQARFARNERAEAAAPAAPPADIALLTEIRDLLASSSADARAMPGTLRRPT